MKKKLLVALAVIITSGVVFAAAKTTFYTILDMTNHKIVNVADPTSNSDAATKAYADTKLSKAGGRMTDTLDMGTNYIVRVHGPRTGTAGTLDAVNKQYVNNTFLPLTGGDLSGRLNMKTHKIINLAEPTDDTDAATKGYVQSYVAESALPGYQYFALRRGGQYKPLISISDSITGDFWAVVIRPFTGSVTTYTDNVTLKASHFYSTKMWKVGETVKIPYTLYQEVSAKTNAALTMVASNGGIGNWGVTFPPPNAPIFKIYFSTNVFYADNPVDVSAYVDSVGQFVFGVTNCTSVASTFTLNTGTLTQYVTSDPVLLQIYPTPDTLTIGAKECLWFACRFYNYSNSTGAIWRPSVYATSLGYFDLGPFFVPNR